MIIVLNSEKCKNIEADGATQSNVGADRQLLYNIMADMEKEIEISADVVKFEMDGISFQDMPVGFDLDEDSLDMSELTDKTSEIIAGAAELSDGLNEIDTELKKYSQAFDMENPDSDCTSAKYFFEKTENVTKVRGKAKN